MTTRELRPELLEGLADGIRAQAKAEALSVLAVDRTKLEHAKSAGSQALAKLESYPCATPEAEQTLADFMNRAHTIVQDLDEEFETLARPLIDSKHELDVLYRDPRKVWKDVKALCKRKISESQTARRKAQEEARQAAIALVNTAPVEAVAAALAKVEDNNKPQGVGVAWEWHAILEDANALEREFLEVSATKINAFAKQYAKSETIPAKPGIRWERRAKVGVR